MGQSPYAKPHYSVKEINLFLPDTASTRLILKSNKIFYYDLGLLYMGLCYPYEFLQ